MFRIEKQFGIVGKGVPVPEEKKTSCHNKRELGGTFCGGYMSRLELLGISHKLKNKRGRRSNENEQKKKKSFQKPTARIRERGRGGGTTS